MSMGATFPAVFTIAFILPALGGSWRLDVLLMGDFSAVDRPSPLVGQSKDSQGRGQAGSGRPAMVAGLEKIRWCGCSVSPSLATIALISSLAPFWAIIWVRLANRNCMARRSAGLTVHSLWRWRGCFSSPIACKCAHGHFWSSARQCSLHFW